MNSINFEDVNIIRETTQYYLCECPECKKKTAFLYKNSNKLNCNRLNNCASEFNVSNIDIKNTYIKVNNSINKEQSKEKIYIQDIFKNLDKVEEVKNKISVSNYRGITSSNVYDINKFTKKNITPFIIDEGRIYNDLKQLLPKVVSDYSQRNIIIPVKNKYDEVEIILLRSSTDNLEIKEKQIKLVDEPKGFYTNFKNSDEIFITEGVLDAISLEQVLPDKKIIGLLGVNRQGNVIDYLKELNNNENIVVNILFDNDRAGEVGAEKLRKKLESLNISNRIFNFPIEYNLKDINDLLNKNLLNQYLEINKRSVMKNKNINEILNSSDTEKNKRVYDYINECIIEAFVSSEKYLEFLEYSYKNIKYSQNNRILLQEQKPDNIYLASFKEFKEMGLSVKKGEKALKIIMPTKIKAFYDDEKKIYSSVKYATPEQKRKISTGEIEVFENNKYFIKGAVFDITQTNATPEQIYNITKLEMKSFEENELTYKIVKDLVSREVPVYEEEIPEKFVHGKYSPKNNIIILEEKLNIQSKINTLLHEYAHAKLHRISRLSSAEKEVQAESFAFITSKYLGVDLDVFHLSYINEHLTNVAPGNREKVLNGIENEIIKFKYKFDNILEEPAYSKHKQITEENMELKNEFKNEIGSDKKKLYPALEHEL